MRGPNTKGVLEGNVGGSGHGGARVNDDAIVSHCIEAKVQGGEAMHRHATDANSSGDREGPYRGF